MPSSDPNTNVVVPLMSSIEWFRFFHAPSSMKKKVMGDFLGNSKILICSKRTTLSIFLSKIVNKLSINMILHILFLISTVSEIWFFKIYFFDLWKKLCPDNGQNFQNDDKKNLLMPKDTTKNIVSNEIGMCIFISYSFGVMLILSHFSPHLWKKQCPDNVKSVEVGGREILLIKKYISWIFIQNEIQCLHIYLYSFRDPLKHFISNSNVTD